MMLTISIRRYSQQYLFKPSLQSSSLSSFSSSSFSSLSYNNPRPLLCARGQIQQVEMVTTHLPVPPQPVVFIQTRSFANGKRNTKKKTTKNKSNNNNNNNNNNKVTNDNPQKLSNRAAFKNIPIHQSILSYIQNIGVGIRPMKHKNKTNRKKRMKVVHNTGGGGGGGNNNNQSGGNSAGGGQILSMNDEKDFFANQIRGTTRFRTSQRNSKRNTNTNRNNGSSTKNNTTNSKTNVNADMSNKNNHQMWIPPPPFSSSFQSTITTTTTSNKNKKTNTNTSTKEIIKKLPIKIIGSVGTIRDKMPRSSKHLPEVAIIGRSNVGKSTLLNALLYGNQFTTANVSTTYNNDDDSDDDDDDDNNGNNDDRSSPPNRKFVRGHTPQGAKLQKGIKAVVSNTPGETKRITFYQLRSKIITETTNDNDDNDDNDKNDNDHQKNRSNQKNQKGNTSTNNTNTNNKMSLVLVDLPGFGFAYTSEERAEEWKELMTHFLISRGTSGDGNSTGTGIKSLKRILLLIDARHGFKKADYDFLELLQSIRLDVDNGSGNEGDNDSGNGNEVSDSDNVNVKGSKRTKKMTLPPIQIILTKSDLVSQNDLARRVVQVRQQLSDTLIREPSSLPVMICSAKAGLGFNNIRGEVARGGILEIQRELAALVPKPSQHN